MDRAPYEPDLIEQSERAIVEIRIAAAGWSELRRDVLDGSQCRDQIGLLEDETERTEPKRCERSPSASSHQLVAQVAGVEHNSEETTAR
jgi:hypothetical protein